MSFIKFIDFLNNVKPIFLVYSEIGECTLLSRFTFGLINSFRTFQEDMDSIRANV